MKTILLTIIVFFITNQLFTQDVIDPAKVFDRDANTTINLTNNEFIRGWNWGAPGAALDAAMGVNWYHDMNLNPMQSFW